MSELTPKALTFLPATVASGVSNISYISGPTYVGPNSINLLFPFVLSNGVLDVNLVNNFSLNTGLPQKLGATVRLSGNSKNATSIGSNLRTYIKNRTWGTHTITDASSISVYTPAAMTMVQQLDETFVGHMDASPYCVTSGAPPSNFALQFPGYGVAYVFLTPLVLNAKDSAGNNFYITLFSSWDCASNAVG
jgi:hypothetical protein